MGSDLRTIFKAYDIRGIHPDQLNEEAASRIGRAFAAWSGAERLVLGRDCRMSSPSLCAAFADSATGAGAKLVPLYMDLDGTFPNHPADPIQPENQADLRRAVTEHAADLGLAFDGDADRVFLVDEHARDVSGSLVTALVAKGMLERHPGSKVVHNLICSWAVPEVIRENGGEPVRTRVGHSFIKQVMAETGAVFGGEHSGHYYFRDHSRADSGLVASMGMMAQLSTARVPLSELLEPFRRYHASGEINSEGSDQAGTIEELAR